MSRCNVCGDVATMHIGEGPRCRAHQYSEAATGSGGGGGGGGGAADVIELARHLATARQLAVLQAWSLATSPDCHTRSVMFVGSTFSLVWEDADGEGHHREAPSLEAAAGLIEMGVVPK